MGEIDRLLQPTSIAVVGASEGRGPGAVLTRNLATHFSGELHLVNPRRPTILGHKTMADLAELPYDIELLVVALSAERTLPVIEQAVGMGLRRAVIVADGFDEPTARTSDGNTLGQYAVENDLTICGPNCLGYMNFHDNVFASIQGVDEYLEHSGRGNLAIVSQSGGMLLATMAGLADRGVGYSHLISSGSEACLGVEQYLEWLIDDSATEVVGVIVEGLHDGLAFLDMANRLIAAGKPVVAFKLGRSTEGQSAVFAHTGKLAGDAAVFDAVCRQAGIALCDDIGQFTESLVAFARMSNKRPRGTRVAAAMISGGASTYVSDIAPDLQLSFPALPDEVQPELARRLPVGAHLGNPLDISGGRSAMDPGNVAEIIDTLVSGGAYDCVLFVIPLKRWGGSPHIRRLLSEILRYSGTSTVPVVLVGINPDGLARDWNEEVVRTGGLALGDLPRALHAIEQVAEYAGRAERARERLRAGWGSGLRMTSRPLERDAPRKALDNAAARELLEDSGIPLVRQAIVVGADQAVRLAEAMGYPVVLKVETPDVPHKTDAGLVALGLASTHDVQAESRRLLKEIQLRDWSDAALTLQPMVPIAEEFVVSMIRDQTFGPIVMFGIGGRLVELIPEGSIALLPLQGESDLEIVERHRMLGQLLSGYRGQPPIDRVALFQVVMALHKVARKHPEILSIEVNPLGRVARSGDLVGLDVLVEAAADEL